MDVALFDRRVELDAGRIGEPEAEVRRQVREYEDGARRTFDLSVALADGFTGDVMAEMRAIPYGETRTYGEVAAELDTAAVAVGRACGENPVPVVVPCHRVVGADSLGGYSAGDGTALKERLLAHERENRSEVGDERRGP